MTRPNKTGASWFEHETHAFYDTKIAILRAKHGIAGYGFYWYMVEKIFLTENYELDLSNEDRKEDIFLIMSAELGIKFDEFVNIVNTCLKQGLFNKELYETKGILTSNGIKKRAQMLEDKREYDRNRKSKSKTSQSVFRTDNYNFPAENGSFPNSENILNCENGGFPAYSTEQNRQNNTVQNRTSQNNTAKNNCASVADDDFLKSCENENGCVASSADDVKVGVGRVSDFKTLQPMTKRNPAELIRSGGILEKDEYCQISKKDIPEIMDIYANKFPEIKEILGTGISKVKLFEIMKSYPLAELTAICWKAKEAAEQNPAGYIMKVLQDTPPNHFWYDEHLPKLEKIITKMYDKTGYGKAIFKNVEAM